MDWLQAGGLILAIITATTALVVQLQRLLVITEQYMKEMRQQNVATNLLAQQAIDATLLDRGSAASAQSEQPIGR